MVKKIVFICVVGILFISDIYIKANYDYDSTKIVIRNTYTYEDLIKEYVGEDFGKINNKQYNEVYSKIESGVFKDQKEFEDIMNKNFTEEGNLVSVDKINKLEKNIYEVNVKVEPPLFTSYEKMKLEQYQEKYFSLKIRLEGLLNYKILDFKKVE